MKTKEHAVIYMVYSSLCMSILNFSVKSCIGPLGVVESTFLRYFVPLVFVIPILVWKGKWRELTPKVGLKMHFLRGFFALAGQLSLNYYLTEATLVNATTLWATGPVYIPIFAHFFYKFKTPWATWVSIAVCLMGVLLMTKPSDGIFDPFSIWGLLAGISTAFSQMLWGANAERGSVSENLFYLYVFASSLSLVVWIFGGDVGKSSVPNTALLWVGIITMALASLGNQFFRSKAYQTAPSFLLTPILYFAVLGAGVLDVVFYQQWPDIWGYIGFAFIAAGTFVKWIYLKKFYDQTLL